MNACLPTKLRFLPNRPIESTIAVTQTVAIATRAESIREPVLFHPRVPAVLYTPKHLINTLLWYTIDSLCEGGARV